MALLHAEVSQAVIDAFYHVYNSLGYGFLEKVYENALRTTLENGGWQVEQQLPVTVLFEGVAVGEYFADLAVARKVIVEVKVARELAPAHEAQLLNYLKATDYQVGLLLNFGPTPEFRRKVFTGSG